MCHSSVDILPHYVKHKVSQLHVAAKKVELFCQKFTTLVPMLGKSGEFSSYTEEPSIYDVGIIFQFFIPSPLVRIFMQPPMLNFQTLSTFLAPPPPSSADVISGSSLSAIYFHYIIDFHQQAPKLIDLQKHHMTPFTAKRMIYIQSMDTVMDTRSLQTHRIL